MPEHASSSADGAVLARVRTTIETYSGLFVDVANPDPATIRLTDIAQGLALTCRYGGQIEGFYSVAEHAVLVHDLLRHQGADRDLLLAGLFHDAAEAYLGDVVSPLKYAQRAEEFDYPGVIHRASRLEDFRGAYTLLSERMDAAIVERYGLGRELEGPELLTADMWALRIEASELTRSGGKHWRWNGALPNDGNLPDDVVWFGGLDWYVARLRWLERVEALGITEPTR